MTTVVAGAQEQPIVEVIYAANYGMISNADDNPYNSDNHTNYSSHQTDFEANGIAYLNSNNKPVVTCNVA